MSAIRVVAVDRDAKGWYARLADGTVVRRSAGEVSSIGVTSPTPLELLCSTVL